MATRAPIIGQWYQDAERDDLFEVVAVDEIEATIEIQYLDGELGEIDFETWQQLVLLPAAEPEDMTASYEISGEDLHEMDDIVVPERWDDPIGSIESESFSGWDDF
ncbi:MAG: DUF6763 family protein [bacterium]